MIYAVVALAVWCLALTFVTYLQADIIGKLVRLEKSRQRLDEERHALLTQIVKDLGRVENQVRMDGRGK